MTVQQIIEFAKMVPGFMTLLQDDQIMLLKGGKPKSTVFLISVFLAVKLHDGFNIRVGYLGVFFLALCMHKVLVICSKLKQGGGRHCVPSV